MKNVVRMGEDQSAQDKNNNINLVYIAKPHLLSVPEKPFPEVRDPILIKKELFITRKFYQIHCPEGIPLTYVDYLGSLEDLKKYNMEIKSLTRFNDLLANKLGISVTLDDIRRHLHFKKMHDDHLKRDYESLCPAELKETLIHEDRRILGALKSMKDEGRILFDYTTTEDKTKLDYVACLDKNQIATYGDLLFIDGTYKINKRKMTLLNLVVMDNDGKSIIGATAFVRNETIESYKKFLLFIKENVAFKRLPIYLISDGGLAIHNAVSHVFHLLQNTCIAFFILYEREKSSKILKRWTRQ